MSLPTRHVLSQGPVLASLGGTALSAIVSRLRKEPPPAPVIPGPELRERLPARPADLVRDYVKHVGGDPSAYRGRVPAHLFPQWGFPLAARTLRSLPYPMERILNAGCRLEVGSHLPAGEPLEVTARLEGIDDDGRRALIHPKVVTGTRSAPEAIVGHLYALVPLGGGDKGKEQGKKKETNGKAPPRVPADAREIGWWKLKADAGLAFAMLTGDFNPVHWIPPYARAFGFKNTILHGFATMARAIEGLNRTLFAGDVDRIATFDCKFTRPLVLPARVGLYVRNDEVYVGDAPSGPAYLVGTFTTRSAS